MSFRKYLSRSVWEFLFCSLSAALLSLCIADGFFIPAALSGSLLAFLLPCLLLNAAAFAFSYSRRSILCGLTLLALVLLAAFLWLYSGASGELGTFFTIVLLTSLTAFFLSRVPLGAAIFGVAGTFVIVGSTLFEYASRPVCLFLFLVFSACLLLSRRYRAAMLKSSTFCPAVRQQAWTSILTCAAALLLTLGVFFAIIAPLDPPTYDLQLKTELNRLPLLEKLGVSSQVYLDDPDKKSEQRSDETIFSDLDDQEAPDTSAMEDAAAVPSPPETFSAFDAADSIIADAISYTIKNHTLYYLAGGLVLLTAGVFAGRLLVRKLRLRRIRSLSPQDQIRAIYTYFLDALEKCGLPPAASDTPLEYCTRLAGKSDRFFQHSGQFHELTEIFCRNYYGGAPPSDEERTQFLRTYAAFPAQCRKSLGLIRYLPVFFKI